MAIFRHQVHVEYTQIPLPSWYSGPIPTRPLHKSRYQAGIDLGKSVIAKIDGGGLQSIEREYPAFAALRRSLVETFSIDRKEEKEAIDERLRFSMMLGWLFAQAEMESEFVKPGMMESTYWITMITFWSQFNKSGSKYEDEALFVMWASYYIARVGSQSMDEVLRRTPGYWKMNPNAH